MNVPLLSRTHSGFGKATTRTHMGADEQFRHHAAVPGNKMLFSPPVQPLQFFRHLEILLLRGHILDTDDQIHLLACPLH